MSRIGVFFLPLVSTLAACQDPEPGPVCEDYNTGVKYYPRENGFHPYFQEAGSHCPSPALRRRARQVRSVGNS